ncbi:DnaA/Hda family protein [Roseimaritima sediminicola]|uniref:DnaA/Hda family protein n=1 Tax=Roseimaritima sediminicola TaxID=2662066 RepID=UPI001386F92B|nr:DnaA/Hda family protein [Roseimaritima sediminicola]
MSLDAIPLLHPAPGPRRTRRAQPQWLLEQYITGPENAFAAFVSRQRDPIALRGNPLLLVGPSGSGKTALAMTWASQELTLLEQAAADRRSAEDVGQPGQSGDAGKSGKSADAGKPAPASMLYMAAADFARDYAGALGADDLEHFRQHIADVDLLVIDDVHTIVDKGPAQEELAARIEGRVRAGRPLILTCRRLPSELRGIRPLLASRMLPGLTVALEPPGGEARLEILTQLCRAASLEIESDWIDLLARSVPDGYPVPRLAALVNHLGLLAQHGRTIDGDAIARALKAVSGGKEPTIAAIAKAVARRFKLKTAELKSSTRRQQVVRARSLAMYLARQLTEASFQQIGEYFGGRDHTTVLYACRKTEELLGTNSQLSQTADEVRELLK